MRPWCVNETSTKNRRVAVRRASFASPPSRRSIVVLRVSSSLFFSSHNTDLPVFASLFQGVSSQKMLNTSYQFIEADCGTAARNRPVCANPAWTLFGLTSNRYFCCPSNFFGVKSVELSGRGVCEPNLDGFPSSRIASTITRGVGGSAPTGTAATGTGGGGGRRTTTGAGGGGGGTPESTGTSISDSNNAGGGNGGSGGSSISAGVIAGAVVGGVVAILLGVALLLWLHRRSLNKAQAASSGSGPGLGPAMGPAPGPAPTPTTETKFYPPPQPSPSPSAGAGAGAGAGMMHQHQYHQPYPTQPQSQYGSPAMVPTPPPPQYASPVPQPPEAYGTPRYEMPVQAQELGSSAVYPTSRS